MQLPFTMGKAESDWPTNNIVRDMVCSYSRGVIDDSPRKENSPDRRSAKVLRSITSGSISMVSSLDTSLDMV
jgi:hypothetical protein